VRNFSFITVLNDNDPLKTFKIGDYVWQLRREEICSRS